MTASFGITSATASVALQAQIAQYKKTLSECRNCESARTPEGKRNIDDLSGKLQQAEAAQAAASNTRADAIRPDAVVEDNTTLYTATGIDQPVASANAAAHIDFFA